MVRRGLAVLGSAVLLLSACGAQEPQEATPTVTHTIEAPAVTVEVEAPAVTVTETTTETATTTVTATPEPEPEPETHRVSDVVDGDTIDVDSGDRIRISGIDTPEKGECGFEEASDRMAELVLDQDVTLVLAGADEVDRYGRLIRYVDVDGVDAGLVLIEEGLAIARYDSRDGYGAHDREDAYIAADEASSPHTCKVESPDVPVPTQDAAPEPAPAPPPVVEPPASDVFYQNCDAARAAGAAPVSRGDPGYSSKLDRDGDGIGCE